MFKKFRTQTFICQNSFVHLCIRIISPTYTSFNAKHFIVNLNNAYQRHGIQKIFTSIRTCTDKNRSTECINTYHLWWKVTKTLLFYGGMHKSRKMFVIKQTWAIEDKICRILKKRHDFSDGLYVLLSLNKNFFFISSSVN